MSTTDFPPPRRRGILVHTVLILALLALFAWSIWRASSAEVGPFFLGYLLLSLAAFIPLPFLGYRAYALLRANYYLDRDRLTLRWGLRVEELPLSDIEWVRPASDMPAPLSLPPLRLPGALLGRTRHPDLGVVEFIAADSRTLLLIGTARRVFAISPADPLAFTRSFQRAIEMGSLTPVAARSLYPSFLVAQAWQDSLTRYLWLSAVLLNLGSLVWVSLLIPSATRVPLGFDAFGRPLGPVLPERLMILPLVSIFLAIAGWLGGLYFYRWEERRVLAYLLWISSALSSLLFLLAVLFAVTTPV